ncbi:MAG: SlyX family protein [Planctomycetota bacterium]
MTEKKIIELQERMAFQEHELDRLNRVVAEQQLELDALVKEVKELRSTLRTANAGEPAEARRLEDDRPPHY